MRKTFPAFVASGLVAALSSSAHAAGLPTATLDPVVISAKANQGGLIGVADSATEGTVTAQQLATRPLLRPAEVMEAVPGMTVTQHSGDGKANQYFLRGFNLDHGSDFATFVLGMPVNMASHGHGQGYMDLNFLIPELVSGLRYRKGMYAAEEGDFATTGAARIDYQRELPAPLVDVSAGLHGYRRLLGAGSSVLGADDKGLTLLGAVELVHNDGPWEQPEGLRKRNAVLRLSSGTVTHGASLSLMAYDARWTATEHVPERAIANGEIGRYGALVPTDGGRTHRHSLSGDWARSNDASTTRANAYLIDYGLNLFSSPSGYINGPQGDQHEQVDKRLVIGGHLVHSLFLGPEWRGTEASLGVQLRHDRISGLGLYDTVARERTNTVREDDVNQTALGLYGEARTQWQAWLRSIAGLRWDQVQMRVSPQGGAFNMDNGGSERGQQWSPKLGLVFGPFSGALDTTEFYANWGRGFHSNDARGTTATTSPVDGRAIDKVSPLVKATGREIGLRTALLPGWSSSLALWQMKLQSELVFVGDEGVTEPKGASHRVGLEWSNYITPNDWLIIDADLAWSRARFDQAVNGGKEVPNAIPLSASLGIAADPRGAWFGGLRLRHVGAYALEETGTHMSSSFLVANLKLGYRFSRQLQLTLDVLNLFDKQANDIEYWGAACTGADGAGCNGGNGIEGRLVHPMEPRTLRVALRASF